MSEKKWDYESTAERLRLLFLFARILKEKLPRQGKREEKREFRKTVLKFYEMLRELQTAFRGETPDDWERNIEKAVAENLAPLAVCGEIEPTYTGVVRRYVNAVAREIRDWLNLEGDPDPALLGRAMEGCELPATVCSIERMARAEGMRADASVLPTVRVFSRSERAVLAALLLVDPSPQVAVDVAAGADLTRKTANKALKSLEGGGYVDRPFGDRSGWVLTEKGRRACETLKITL